MFGSAGIPFALCVVLRLCGLRLLAQVGLSLVGSAVATTLAMLFADVSGGNARVVVFLVLVAAVALPLAHNAGDRLERRLWSGHERALEEEAAGE